MLNINYLKNNKKDIINGLIKREFNNIDIIDSILLLDNKRKIIKKKLDMINFNINKISKKIQFFNCIKDHDKLSVYRNKVFSLKIKKKELIKDLRYLIKNINNYLIIIPNIPNSKVDNNNKQVYNSLNKNLLLQFNTCLPHWELGKKFNIINFELGSKITGNGFPVFIGKGASLVRSLIKYFLDINISHGYTEYDLPLLVNENSVFSSGHLPDKENIMYHLHRDNYYLVPTSEITLINCFRDCVLSYNSLPLKLTSYSLCFRRESGSYGVRVRGLNRVHQFGKVEIVQITQPEKSYLALKEMVNHVKYILKSLSLPFRIIKLSAKDLGFTSSITYDFEVYSYVQKKWLEVSSVSSCLDFQSIRLNLRYKNADNIKNYCHTLNGSSLALPRILITILENNQKKNSIIIPKALIPYTGFSKLKID